MQATTEIPTDTYRAINAAWYRIGADVAGLSWYDFAYAIYAAEKEIKEGKQLKLGGSNP